MIRRIVEADNEARAIEEANRKNTEEEKKRIEARAAAIYQTYMTDAQSVIAKNDSYIEKQTEKRLAEIEAKQESVLIKLRADYGQNRDKWVDEIVSRVVG